MIERKGGEALAVGGGKIFWGVGRDVRQRDDDGNSACRGALRHLGVGYNEYGRQRAEVLVDTVTYVVCSSVGLDTAGSSVPYVAGWGENGELEAIRTYAQTLDKLARRIEDALSDTRSHLVVSVSRC